MKYPLCVRLFLFYFFSNAYTAIALPFVEADAFAVGDNLAMYDQTSGLSWLDWGVTNWHTGVRETLHHLKRDPKYYHWRMPTEMEVRYLVTHLNSITIDDQPDAIAGDPAVGAALTDIWGYNIDYQVWGEGYHTYSSQGYFRTENGWGLLHFLYALNPDETRYHTGFYTWPDPTIPDDWSFISDVWSTVLVRDGSNVLNVPEPAALILFLLGLFGIISSRFFRQRHLGNIRC